MAHPPNPTALVRLLQAFLRDDGGSSAIQYAIIASLISAFLIGAYQTLGQAQTDLFERWTDAVDNAIAGAGGGGGGGGGGS